MEDPFLVRLELARVLLELHSGLREALYLGLGRDFRPGRHDVLHGAAVQSGAQQLDGRSLPSFGQRREMRLHPTEEDGRLFFVFRDLTSGKETYAAGRFLYADMPRDGRVVLDFNKAYNPPCAFTPYATCPLPPPENRLQVRVEAGEKIYERH